MSTPRRLDEMGPADLVATSQMWGWALALAGFAIWGLYHLILWMAS